MDAKKIRTQGKSVPWTRFKSGNLYFAVGTPPSPSNGIIGAGENHRTIYGAQAVAGKNLEPQRVKGKHPGGRADGFVPLAALAMITFFLLECKVRCRCRLGLWICSRPRVRG